MKTLLILVLVAAAAPAATIVKRQVNQQSRIGTGVRSGSLTRVETARIQSREAALAREVRRDRIDGGGLSLAERVKIDHKQDALSHDIARLKHNGRVR